MKKEQFEELLVKHLDDIRGSAVNGYGHTSRNVWGKEVVIVKKDHSTVKYPLQNWYVSVPFDESMDFDTVLKILKYQVHDKELEEIRKVTDISLALSQDSVVIEQLCDWQFLESMFGEIISANNVITLVKYAVVIKKEEYE